MPYEEKHDILFKIETSYGNLEFNNSRFVYFFKCIYKLICVQYSIVTTNLINML